MWTMRGTLEISHNASHTVLKQNSDRLLKENYSLLEWRVSILHLALG